MVHKCKLCAPIINFVLKRETKKCRRHNAATHKWAIGTKEVKKNIMYLK